MNELPAEQYLGFKVLDRKALFKLLTQAYGKRDKKTGELMEFPYRTFYTWATELKISTKAAAYSAEDVLSLIVYMWLRKRGNRNLDRKTVKQFFGAFQNEKGAIDLGSFTLDESQTDKLQDQPSPETPGDRE